MWHVGDYQETSSVSQNQWHSVNALWRLTDWDKAACIQ